MEDYKFQSMYNIPYHGNADLSHSAFLITGGAGFIGSNVAEYLLKYKAGKVRILDNFSTGFKKNIEPFLYNPAFELIEGDIRNYADCKKALHGIDYVSHQAALGSVPRSVNHPLTSNEVNVNGFLNILIAAKDKQVKRLVYASSSSVYGDDVSLPKKEDCTGKPLSPYAVTKAVNEMYAGVFSKVYNFHTIGLRYFNVFGPKQSSEGAYAAVIPLFIGAALNNTAPFINGDGETSRDFTFVENAVQANIKALLTTNLKNDEVINISCGERITLNELWMHINKIARLNIQPEHREERKGDVKHSLGDISKAKKLIGYKPEFSFENGLQIALTFYKKENCLG